MKVHRAVVPEPITTMQGHDWVRALCGAGIERPVLIIDAEGDLQDPETVNAIGNCSKCKAITIPNEGTLFIYGVVSGEEFRRAMRDEGAKALEGAE